MCASLTSNAQSSLAQHMKDAGESSCIHYLFRLLWHTGTCRGKMLWRQLSRLSSPLYFITLHHPLAFLLLLGLLVFWVVDADSKLASLCAILVLDQESVFARVGCGDGGDCDAGKLPMLKLEFVVVIRYQPFVILRPGHLRYRITPDIASQVQGLKKKKKIAFGIWYVTYKTGSLSSEERYTPRKVTMKKKVQGETVYYQSHSNLFTLPSWIATTSGKPPTTRARSEQEIQEQAKKQMSTISHLTLVSVQHNINLTDFWTGNLTTLHKNYILFKSMNEICFKFILNENFLSSVPYFSIVDIPSPGKPISMNKILILCLMQTNASWISQNPS